MWGAPFIIFLLNDKCQMTKLMIGWMLLMLGQFGHWKLLKHECILSLIEKRSEDPSYVMGSDPGKSYVWKTMNKLLCLDLSENEWKTFHYEFTKMNVLLGIGFVTMGNKCAAKHKLLKAVAFIIAANSTNRFLESQRNAIPK
jgi:hypothetical protein